MIVLRVFEFDIKVRLNFFGLGVLKAEFKRYLVILIMQKLFSNFRSDSVTLNSLNSKL